MDKQSGKDKRNIIMITNANKSQKLHIKKQSIKLIVGIILYRLSLVFAFFAFVLVYYKDNYYVSVNLATFVISYLMFVISVFFTARMLKCRANYMSGQLFLLAYLFSYVPSTVLCSYMWNNIVYTVVSSLFWILTMLILSFKSCRVKNTEFKLFSSISPNSRTKLFKILTFTILLVVLLVIYSYNKFKFSFSFSALYDVRAEMKSTISTLQGLVFFCAATIISPILIGIFCKKRKYICLLLVCVLQILLFLVGGDKFYILICGVGIILAIFYKKKYIFIIPLVFAVIIGLSTVFIALTNGTFFENWIYDIGVRRVLFTPAYLNYFYFDFSQFSPKILFTDHQVLSRILVKIFNVDIPYDDMVIADKLGLFYWNETGKSNGGFGNAFAQVGYMCLVIYPVLYLLIGNIFDKITVNMDVKVYMPLVASLTIYLLDYSISGIEITHILFAFILYGLSYSYLSENIKQKHRRRYEKKCIMVNSRS